LELPAVGHPVRRTQGHPPSASPCSAHRLGIRLLELVNQMALNYLVAYPVEVESSAVGGAPDECEDDVHAAATGALCDADRRAASSHHEVTLSVALGSAASTVRGVGAIPLLCESTYTRSRLSDGAFGHVAEPIQLRP